MCLPKPLLPRIGPIVHPAKFLRIPAISENAMKTMTRNHWAQVLQPQTPLFRMKTKLVLPILALLVTLLGAATASAATTYYSAATGNWSSTSTWATTDNGSGGHGPPTSADTVVVDETHTVTVDVNNAACASLQLGSSTSGNGAGTIAFNSGSQLTVSTTLTVGESSVRLGSINMTSGGLLIYSGSAAITVNDLGTFTAGTGTIEYNYAGAQTVTNALGSYNNLTLAGSGAKTTTSVTVNGILNMAGTATASAAPTYGSAATLQYDQTVTAGPEWLATFAATGGVVINTGTVTLNGAKIFSASVPLTINSGATLATANDQLTFGGDYANNGGTLTAGSSPIVITGTAATQTLMGSPPPVWFP